MIVPHKKTHQVTNYALHGDLNNIRNPCGFKLFQKIRILEYLLDTEKFRFVALLIISMPFALK